MTEAMPPAIGMHTRATPDAMSRWAEAFDECGGGTVEEFAEWLLTNARASDMERMYVSTLPLGLDET